MSSGCTYDAVSILGFGDAVAEPLPQAKEGEIVLRYGGWSLQELRDSSVGRKLMHDQDWYNAYPWSSEKLPSGIYRLRIPVAESNCKTFAEQERMLRRDESIAPVVLVASGLLVHHLQTGEDPLKNDWIRCRNQAARGGHVALSWFDGQLDVDYWFGGINTGLWLSSVRTS